MTARRRRATLALGSNLGDREAYLRAAVDSLHGVPGLAVVAASSVYESAASGGPKQGPYLNAVLLAETSLTADELMDVALVVESAHGRTRTVRWGPRTLDVDVLAVGDEVSDDPRITLPHPRAHERAFVLVPWSDVDPDAVIPRWGRVLDLLGALGPGARAEVRLVPGVQLAVPERP